MKSMIPTLALAALMTAPAFSAVVYSSGHADFGIGYEDGDFHFHFHAEGATVDGSQVEDEEFDIPDVITTVSTDAMTTLSGDLAPLGAQAGDTVWILPQEEGGSMTIPILGLATEELAPEDWGNITFTLNSVNSPGGSGHFALWQSGPGGEISLLAMSTADAGADFFTLTPGEHSHFNWGFTEAGIWEIEVTVSGTHSLDGFQSATETLVFHVVPEPSAFLLGGLGLAGFALRRRRR